jgi:hypothetical protein
MRSTRASRGGARRLLLATWNCSRRQTPPTGALPRAPPTRCHRSSIERSSPATPSSWRGRGWERIGLAAFFPPGQGAFGCDAEERVDLIDIARRRAGDWPREQTVAVGDTEADVAGARAAGIRVIGFGPDPALAHADAVIERLAELSAALERVSAPT